MAALLLAAWEKLVVALITASEGGPTSSVTVMIRNCIMSKIRNLIYTEISSLGRSQSRALAQKLKDKREPCCLHCNCLKCLSELVMLLINVFTR